MASSVDITDITQAITAIFVGTDEHDWSRVQAAFAPQVLLDYTSMAGGEPARLTPEQIVTAWQALLPGFEHTHHQLGNFDVRLVNDREATAFCYGTATHYLPQPTGSNVWTVVGTYEFHLVREGATWHTDRLKFNLKYQDGNLELPNQAAERVILRSRG
ncbi:nuclear transport factor 2 family protein [Hymenobacter volaticus]|uniref:Nuclear transport factor 2 family protein n=1 Tax=Hymenobacter volaticus TaxID=2932254 RepID=A0ABY4GEY8_9BACT|nr:nuclear transport factor 2 family protein [Hymenobacter volaticus]UOQ69386.1 nuclear transport factor 2 family protein [Hymenobacter volaticus]